MTYTTTANRENLSGIYVPESLKGKRFKLDITPISDEEAAEIEFKTLKGIAGEELDIDMIRKERLHI